MWGIIHCLTKLQLPRVPRSRDNENLIWRIACSLFYTSLILVDCTWDDWAWESCSKPCGNGVQNGTRTISQPAEHGGNNCTGPYTDTRNCNLTACPGELMIRNCITNLTWSRGNLQYSASMIIMETFYVFFHLLLSTLRDGTNCCGRPRQEHL